MTVFNLPCNFSDEQLDEIDNLRGSIERDDFLRIALQMGLLDVRNDSSMSEQDNLRSLLLAQTRGFQHVKSLRTINAADTKHDKKKEA
jgi:hypothetical protein